MSQQIPPSPAHIISIFVEPADRGWRAEVRHNGDTREQCFTTEEEARVWAEAKRLRIESLFFAIDGGPTELSAQG